MKTRRSQIINEKARESTTAKTNEQNKITSSLNTVRRMKRKCALDMTCNSPKRSKINSTSPKKDLCDCEKVAQEEFFHCVERYCPDDDESYAQCLLDMCHFYKFGEHVMHDLINARKRIFVLEKQLEKLTKNKPVNCCKEIDLQKENFSDSELDFV